VNDLLTALLGTLLATNTPVATSNLIQQQTGLSVSIPDTQDPEEQEFERLLELDDQAQGEVDEWIQDNNAFVAQGGGLTRAELNIKILQRFDIVRTNYLSFLAAHTNHARAHLAYASFLNDIGKEDEAVEFMEKARGLDPANPAAWNNLANYHGHRGNVKTAFDYYAKAIELDPNEPVYYQNYGTTVFLFRKDAKEHFGITEQEVFDKALTLYAGAIRLDPANFPLATDIAQTYYGIKPLRTNEAFIAWNYAMSIARDQIERDGVHIHLARLSREIGNYDEARRQLNIITNAMYGELKQRIARSIEEEEAEAKGQSTANTPETEEVNETMRTDLEVSGETAPLESEPDEKPLDQTKQDASGHHAH
jgi:tetratricopeptide (TPR) repeat protein